MTEAELLPLSFSEAIPGVWKVLAAFPVEKQRMDTAHRHVLKDIGELHHHKFKVIFLSLNTPCSMY